MNESFATGPVKKKDEHKEVVGSASYLIRETNTQNKTRFLERIASGAISVDDIINNCGPEGFFILFKNLGLKTISLFEKISTEKALNSLEVLLKKMQQTGEDKLFEKETFSSVEKMEAKIAELRKKPEIKPLPIAPEEEEFPVSHEDLEHINAPELSAEAVMESATPNPWVSPDEEIPELPLEGIEIPGLDPDAPKK